MEGPGTSKLTRSENFVTLIFPSIHHSPHKKVGCPFCPLDAHRAFFSRRYFDVRSRRRICGRIVLETHPFSPLSMIDANFFPPFSSRHPPWVRIKFTLTSLVSAPVLPFLALVDLVRSHWSHTLTPITLYLTYLLTFDPVLHLFSVSLDVEVSYRPSYVPLLLLLPTLNI